MENKQRYNGHSVSRLTAHIVWVTKYRYKVLEGDIKIRCRTLIKQICEAEDVALPNKNVFENVAFALEIVGIGSKEIKHTVPKVLDIVNLKGKEKRMPHELSGGERQRVAIARAIVRQPRILIADEPTGNLDPKHAWDVIKVLEKINRYGTTVLLTTHNADVVNKLKRRVVTLEHGKVASDRANAEYHVQ